MPPTRAERLPSEPLEAILRGRYTYQDEHVSRARYHPGAAMADLGFCPRQIYRWRTDGIPYYMADRVACRLGLHPALIWGADWFTEETP